jgi:hypothetical protein
MPCRCGTRICKEDRHCQVPTGSPPTCIEPQNTVVIRQLSQMEGLVKAQAGVFVDAYRLDDLFSTELLRKRLTVGPNATMLRAFIQKYNATMDGAVTATSLASLGRPDLSVMLAQGVFYASSNSVTQLLRSTEPLDKEATNTNNDLVNWVIAIVAVVGSLVFIALTVVVYQMLKKKRLDGLTELSLMKPYQMRSGTAHLDAIDAGQLRQAVASMKEEPAEGQNNDSTNEGQSPNGATRESTLEDHAPECEDFFDTMGGLSSRPADGATTNRSTYSYPVEASV